MQLFGSIIGVVSMKNAVQDENDDLSKCLIWSVGRITQATPDERARVAEAHRQAQEVVQGIPKNEEGARARIILCIHRSDELKAKGDIASVGWLLTAIEERANERDLRDWRKLRAAARNAVKLLLVSHPTVH